MSKLKNLGGRGVVTQRRGGGRGLIGGGCKNITDLLYFILFTQIFNTIFHFISNTITAGTPMVHTERTTHPQTALQSKMFGRFRPSFSGGITAMRTTNSWRPFKMFPSPVQCPRQQRGTR